jgi:uncharacterized HAD superfamily protein
MTAKPAGLRKHLILFDIDGVIANDDHRVQFALDKNWVEYFELIQEDPVLQEGYDLATYYAKSGFEVQYLTGRRIDLYEKTAQWLRDNGFPNPEKITMRGFAHRDILAKFKAGVLKNAIEGGEFESVHLYEDDPAVVAYANELFGEGTATLTTWYVKKAEMVKAATA